MTHNRLASVRHINFLGMGRYVMFFTAVGWMASSALTDLAYFFPEYKIDYYILSDEKYLRYPMYIP